MRFPPQWPARIATDIWRIKRHWFAISEHLEIDGLEIHPARARFRLAEAFSGSLSAMLRRYGTTLIGGDAAKGNLVSNAAITPAGGLPAAVRKTAAIFGFGQTGPAAALRISGGASGYLKPFWRSRCFSGNVRSHSDSTRITRCRKRFFGRTAAGFAKTVFRQPERFGLPAFCAAA